MNWRAYNMKRVFQEEKVARAMVSAGIPCTKEPLGLSRSDGKRPDGLPLVSWGGGKATDLGRNSHLSVGRLTRCSSCP